MNRRRVRTAIVGGMLAASMMVAVAGVAMLPPAPAIAAASGSDPNALVLTTEAPGTVHELHPGSPALWNVGVTLRRIPVSTLVGIVTVAGSLTSTHAASVPTRLELLGCPVQWHGDACITGARVILPSTATSQLPRAALDLSAPAQPIPAKLWVQARVTLDAETSAGITGELNVRLTVNAIGDEGSAHGALSSLAATGSFPLGAGLLALAAVSTGLALAALARGRRHG